MIPEGYRGADFMGRLRNVGINSISNTNIQGRFWIYPNGHPEEASVLRDEIYGPFSVGAYESHYFTVWKTWTPGSYRVMLQHNYGDDNASNNSLESRMFYVATSTPTPTLPPTPTPTWTPTPTFTGTPIPPTPTNTPVTPTATYTPSPTPAYYNNDLAAWDLALDQVGGNYYQRNIKGWIKNVGTSIFDVGSVGLRYRFYRRNLETGIVSLIWETREYGPEESPGYWPVGRVASLEKKINVGGWDYGYYDVWLEHNAADPQEETDYSEQDQNSSNDTYYITGFIVPTPTPTSTSTPTPNFDAAAISLTVPATPIVGGWNTISFTGRIGSVAEGNITENNIRGRMVLNPWPYHPSHEGHGDVIHDEFGFGPFPTNGSYEDKTMDVYRLWNAGTYYIRWEHNLADINPSRDRNAANDQIRSASFVIVAPTPTPTIIPTATPTPTRPPLGLVIELDDKIWYFTRTGQYLVQ